MYVSERDLMLPGLSQMSIATIFVSFLCFKLPYNCRNIWPGICTTLMETECFFGSSKIIHSWSFYSVKTHAREPDVCSVCALPPRPWISQYWSMLFFCWYDSCSWYCFMGTGYNFVGNLHWWRLWTTNQFT